MTVTLASSAPNKASAQSTFRPSVPADLGAITGLLSRSFGVAETTDFLQPDLMRWKFWDPRGDWTGPRSFVLERGGRVVAHAGIWPVVVRAEGAEHRGVHVIDWAAEAGVAGAGLSLMQRIRTMFDFVYSIGGSATTLALLPSFGFKEVAHSWTAARPLRPFAMAAADRRRDWRALARLCRNARWSMFPAASTPHGWDVEPLEIDRIPSEMAGVDRQLPRGRQFFEYLSRCPAGETFAFAATNRGVVKGFFVLFHVGRQVKLAGAWLDGSAVASQAAFPLVQEAARSIPEACELVVMGSTAASAAAAIAAGLRVRVSEPVLQAQRAGVAGALGGVEFQLNDFDGVFFHDSATPFLC